MQKIYSSKQIFETDKINELLQNWDKNYITNDKNEIIERQDCSVRYYKNEIENYKRQKEYLESELLKQNKQISDLQKKYEDLVQKDKFIVTKTDVGLQLDMIQEQQPDKVESRNILEKYLDYSNQNPAYDQSLSYENVDAIIAAIFSDKALYDHQHYIHRQQYKDLKEYVIHWFNSKLGNSSLAKHYL